MFPFLCIIVFVNIAAGTVTTGVSEMVSGCCETKAFNPVTEVCCSPPAHRSSMRGSKIHPHQPHFDCCGTGWEVQTLQSEHYVSYCVSLVQCCIFNIVMAILCSMQFVIKLTEVTHMNTFRK